MEEQAVYQTKEEAEMLQHKQNLEKQVADQKAVIAQLQQMQFEGFRQGAFASP